MSIPKNIVIPRGSSQFAKFQDGVNKFRFLSDIIYGWEGWKDQKPFRHEGETCKIKPEQVDLDRNGRPNINYFWAVIVWNYKENKVQVLEITQKTIMSMLYEYEQKEEYGDLKGYDVEISKSKEGDKTTYKTIGMPPKPITKEIKIAFEETDVKLEKIFEGEYPITEEIESDDVGF